MLRPCPDQFRAFSHFSEIVNRRSEQYFLSSESDFGERCRHNALQGLPRHRVRVSNVRLAGAEQQLDVTGLPSLEGVACKQN